MSKSATAAKHLNTRGPHAGRGHPPKITAKTRHLQLVRDDEPEVRVRSAAEIERLRARALNRARQEAAPLRIAFDVNPDVAPALRSAIDELCTVLGGRLEHPRPFKVEDALTCAVQALGPLRAALYAAVPAGDDRWAV